MSSFQIKLNWFVPNEEKEEEKKDPEDGETKMATTKKKAPLLAPIIDNQSRSHCKKEERTLTIDDRSMTLQQFLERVRGEVLLSEDDNNNDTSTIRLRLYKQDVYPSLKFVPMEEDPAKLLLDEISARSTVLVGLDADENDDGASESADVPHADAAESEEEEGKKRKRSDDDVVEIDDQKPPAKKVAAAEDDDDDVVEIVDNDDDDEWACPRCTLLNSNAATVCSACDGTRDGTVDVSPANAPAHAHAVAQDGVRAPDPVRREQLIGGPPDRGMHFPPPYAAAAAGRVPPRLAAAAHYADAASAGLAAAAHYADAASAEHRRRSRRRRQEEEAEPEQQQQQQQGHTAEDAVLIE